MGASRGRWRGGRAACALIAAGRWRGGARHAGSELRVEGLRDPLPEALPHSAFLELFQGVLVGLREVFLEDLIHLPAEVFVVHAEVDLFVDLRGAGVEVGG